MRVAPTSRVSVPSPKAPPTNHAAGSHRRERSRPVGKSRNTKASMAMGTAQIQLDSHMPRPGGRHRPRGRDQSRARRRPTRSRLSPSIRPVARASQPIRFAGRLEARTKPMTGMDMLTTFARDVGEVPARQARWQPVPVHVGQDQRGRHQCDRGRRDAAGHPSSGPRPHLDPPSAGLCPPRALSRCSVARPPPAGQGGHPARAARASTPTVRCPAPAAVCSSPAAVRCRPARWGAAR